MFLLVCLVCLRKIPLTHINDIFRTFSLSNVDDYILMMYVLDDSETICGVCKFSLFVLRASPSIAACTQGLKPYILGWLDT